MFKLPIFLFFTFFLSSCQLAQSLEGYRLVKNWQLGGDIAPQSLLDQAKTENLSPDTIGDPKRFRVAKVNGRQKNLYLIFPRFGECPEDGCATQSLRDLYYPLCGVSGACGYLAYVEADGQFRQVFAETLWAQVPQEELFYVSEQLSQGLPACFQFKGFTYEHRSQVLEGQIGLTTYCYDGAKYKFASFSLISR